MGATAQTPSHAGSGRWFPLAVLGMGLALTGLAVHQIAQNLRLRTEVEAEALSRDIDFAIRSRMRAYVALLQSGAALLVAHPELSRDEFRQYVGRLNISNDFAGIQGLGFTFRIPPEKLEEFEKLARLSVPDFKVWPQSIREEYHAITYLEPADARNLAALGYDMFTEPIRRQAMEQARDTGQAALSGRVTLVQEIQGPKQPGFLIYIPVYQASQVPADVLARRERLLGFCYAPFRAGDLFDRLAEQSGIQKASFEVYDGHGAVSTNLLYQQSAPSAEEGRAWKDRELSINVAGHPWTVKLWVPRLRLSGSPVAAGAAAGGVALSLILFYLTRAEARARQQAEYIASQLRLSEQALRRSGENLRLMIQSARDYAIFSLDSNGRISSWNAGAQRLFGYSETVVLGKEPALLYTDEDRSSGMPEQELQRAARSGVSQTELWQTRQDGARFFASRVIHPIYSTEGVLQGYLTIARDITSQMEAREKLIREKEFSEAIISSLPGLFLALNEQGRLLRWNRAVEEISGRSADQLRGMLVGDLAPAADRERLLSAIHEAFATGDASFEVDFTGNGGRTIPFLFTGSRAQLNEAPCIIGIGLDISQRKVMEKSLQEAQRELQIYTASLEQRVAERTAELHQSLASLEGVLYHVAHDLRAPLRAMGSFISILLEEYAVHFDERGRGYALRVTDAARRMDELLLDLLAYGRLAHMDIPVSKIDLEDQIKAVLAKVSSRMEKRGAKVELVPPFGSVCANKSVLLDVLMQLISNALKFVPPEQNPHIRIWAEPTDERVRLWIQDNGIGIKAEYHERVFRVFERLHGEGVYSGTGIGLAMVAKGVERMDGNVGLESEPGKGSRFWIELPKV